jgi:hypothetical protein
MICQLLVSNRFAAAIDPRRIAAAGASLEVALGDVLDDRVPEIGDRLQRSEFRYPLASRQAGSWVAALVPADIARALVAWALEARVERAVLARRLPPIPEAPSHS